MNIMIADAPKRVPEPVDTTEHILLVHVVILDLQVVELVALAVALVMVAVALYAMTHAANAATLVVQHHHHQHVHRVVILLLVVSVVLIVKLNKALFVVNNYCDIIVKVFKVEI
jgi:hypothetical protein